VPTDIEGEEVVGGIRVHVDIDNGSRFYNLPYRMEMSKKDPIPFLGKLIFCNQITAFICDDCFEERHERCYGTKIEVKRTYEDVFPCGSSEQKANDIP
jgi:hypothetical protein